MPNTTKRFAERLGGAFALATLLAALVGLASLAALLAVGSNVAPPQSQTLQADGLRADGLRTVIAARSYAATKNPTWLTTRDAAGASLAQSIARLRSTLAGQNSLRALDVVDQRSLDLDLALDREVIGATTGLGDRAQLVSDATARQQAFDQSVGNLVEEARREGLTGWRRTLDANAQARRNVATAGAAAILFAAGFGLLLMRRFSRQFERVQETVRVREEFLSLASEELSRPLSALAHHVEPVREALHHPADKAMQGMLAHHLDVANHELEKLEELVHELHEAARLRSGVETLRREQLDLAQLARNVARQFDARVRASGTTIVVQASSIVRGFWDRVRIEEALTQLMGGAIRHGTGKVVKVALEGGDPVHITIRNHGKGMQETDRADQPANVESHDSLGLFVARQIIEEHGGSLEVVDTAGVGSLVTVELPRGAPATRRPPRPRLPFSVPSASPT